MSFPIVDIWFRTQKSLSQIGEHLQLSDVTYDAENYWEWVIGDFGGARIDITRTHTQPRASVYVRIFRLDNAPFNDALKPQLIQALRRFVRGEIFCGRWIFTSGNDFDVDVSEVHT